MSPSQSTGPKLDPDSVSSCPEFSVSSLVASRLRLQDCHCCGLGCCCAAGLISGPGTLAMSAVE